MKRGVEDTDIETKEEFERYIRASRDNIFQIDYEAIMNGRSNSLDFIEFSEYIDFEVLKYFEADSTDCLFLKNVLFNIMYARVDGYNWFNVGKSVYSYNDFEEATFSIRGTNALHHLLFTSPLFPFGFREEAYNRHKKIMMKRYDDIKAKLLIPPNFKDGLSYGLSEMNEYLSDKNKRNITTRPKVKGKTFILNYSNPKLVEDVENGRKFEATSYITKYYREVGFNREFITNVTFLNRFDNVEHPLNYLLDWKYKFVKHGKEKLNYGWESIDIFAALLIKSGRGYESWDEDLSHYDIICFNLFELPLRELVIETIIKFLLAYQKKHPNVYIKDISGLGYYPYKNYPFYEELRASKIDVGV